MKAAKRLRRNSDADTCLELHWSRAEISKLREAMAANRVAYQRLCRPGAGRRVWDYCIVTAANERQARGYRIELARRKARGLIPEPTHVIVVPDPGGARIGSGAATLNVLRVVATHLAGRLRATGLRPASISSLFANRRILVVHSGGDSKRIPHYSSYGKIFGTIPRPLLPDTPSTVFDELMIALAQLPQRMDEGMLVASGDVLLAFDPQDVNLRWPGVTGIAFRAPWRLGTRHGVYVQSRDATHVADFLQKPSKRELDSHGAIDAQNRVCLDSGLVRFDVEEMTVLAQLAGISLRRGSVQTTGGILEFAAKRKVLIDLYDEILRPLAPRTDEDVYLNVPGDGPRRVRYAIWQALRHIPFRVCALSPAVLLHIGTTREFRELVTRNTGIARLFDLQKIIDSYILGDSTTKRTCIVSSILSNGCVNVGSGSVVEHSHLSGDYRIGKGAVVCGVRNRTACLRVAADAVAHEVVVRRPARLRRRMAQTNRVRVLRLYGVTDDPKQPLLGGSATFFGRNLGQWLRERRIDPEHIWPGISIGERSLWNAKLYPPLTDEDSYDLVMWMQEHKTPPSALLKRWMKAERLSLADTFEDADCRAIAAERDAAKVHRCELELAERLPSDAHCLSACSGLDSLGAFRGVVRFIRSWTQRQSEPLLRMRGNKAISDILGSPSFRSALYADSADRGQGRKPMSQAAIPPAHEAEAWKIFRSNPSDVIVYDALSRFYLEETFDDVSRAVEMGVCRPRFTPRLSLKPGQQILIEAPVRIDFGGGWSDTPPHSLRCGGAVLNAAVRLNGAYPVRATVKVLDEPVLRLISRDAGYEVMIVDKADVLDYANPSDPVGLLKAAICCVGVIPIHARSTLKHALRSTGGGLEVTTESNVPKGSGLGTSSIIAAALLKALFRLLGYEPSNQDLFSHVSYVEQMVSTGGGWQDQIGAMTPGIKLIATRPGHEQRPKITVVKLSRKTARALSRRLMLLYTGERRLAKDILQSIMGKYISGEPTVVRILREIQGIARAMKRALQADDLDSFGKLMARHWEVNKQLDPQSTTPRIEHILHLAAPHIVGAKMVGAGGGGFMMLVGRSTASKGHIERSVAKHLARQGVSLWNWDLALEVP